MNKFAIAACAALAAVPAAAQRLDDDFIIQASLYLPKVNSTVQVDGANGNIGTIVDFENDLGLSSHSTLPAFMAEWRPGDDWVFTGEYYALGRNATKTIGRELVIGDTTYPVNASLKAGFDSDVYRFTIGNRILQGKNYEIGLALGLHGTNFSIFVEGEGDVGEVGGSFRSETRSIFAPLPTLGVFAAAEPVKNIYLGARFDWLSLSIDEYSGRLINTEFTAAYRIHKNVDIGGMYRFVNYRVRVDKPKWHGEVQYEFHGPALFLQLGF